jgi:rhamnose transport system permease protein
MKRFIQVHHLREASLLLVILVVVFVFGNQIENYFTASTFTRISSTVAIIAVVAVGQTLVILTRNVDLSVGSIVGFTAYFVGHELNQNQEISPALILLMAISLGAAMGLVNGLLVAYGRVPAIVVTLGTMAIYRGIFVEYSNSESVVTARLPDWVKDLPRESVLQVGELELRALPAIAIAMVILFNLLLVYTHWGRRLYAIGSNPEAAELAGISSQRRVAVAFTLSGALAGLGGFMYLARIGTITVVAAQGLELQVVAAAVVGGVSILGGTGTMFGALLGACLIGIIEQSLIRMNINEFWKDAILGLSILLAVATDSVIVSSVQNWWSRTVVRPINTTSEKTA